MPDVTTVVGDAILPHVPALARLRRIVFRDWPYLYDGDDAYEADYIATYARCPRAALAIAWDGNEAVGVSSCLPLLDETDNVVAPFRAAGLEPSRWFYFGESVLLQAYRGTGVGVAFFERREAHARSFGAYGHAAFCAVQRPDDHPMRPRGAVGDAVPLDGFWRRRGFAPRPGLTCIMRWRDLGRDLGRDLSHMDETDHTMQFWTKDLTEDAA